MQHQTRMRLARQGCGQRPALRQTPDAQAEPGEGFTPLKNDFSRQPVVVPLAEGRHVRPDATPPRRPRHALQARQLVTATQQHRPTFAPVQAPGAE